MFEQIINTIKSAPEFENPVIPAAREIRAALADREAFMALMEARGEEFSQAYRDSHTGTIEEIGKALTIADSIPSNNVPVGF